MPRRAHWKRLEELLDRSRRQGIAALDDDELTELARLYRAATTHLAQRRTFGATAGTLDQLNRLVADAHHVIYGRAHRGSGLRVIAQTFLAFPEVVRKTAAYHVVALALLLIGGLYGFAGASHDPEWALRYAVAGDVRVPYATTEELRETLLTGRDPDAPMATGEKAQFASFLWQNNTRVALLAFFAGFFAGVPTVFLLLTNGLHIGVYSATFHSHGLATEWWAWILPHGVTEFLAIILLAGGGLYLGRQIIAPGARTRRAALRDARAPALNLALFAFPMLFAAALLESFLRQSTLGDPARYVVALGTAGFWAFYLGFVRVPASWRESEQERRTQAERWVALPLEDELFGARARVLRRRAAAPRETD
jgi:uncharacterized membrane protein SpoIIM required for sporulation